MPAFQIRVQPTLDLPGLRLRAQATTSAATLAFEAPGAVLTALEAEASVRSKLGVNGQWLKVRDANGLEGFVAAWFVEAAPAMSAPETAPKPVSTPNVSAPNPQALVDAINAERIKNKLPILTVNPILTKNAQSHADFMAATGQIQHESADGSRPFQRHLAAGYPLAGDLTRGGICSENIVAFPNMTVAEAITSWFGDDPHTHTMLGDQYTECGAGIAVKGETIYYCFDTARPTSANRANTTATAPVPPPADAYILYVPLATTSGVRIRKQPSQSAGLIRVAAAGEWLAVQENKSAARSKLGKQNQWIKIKDQKGNTGFVAAWLVAESK